MKRILKIIYIILFLNLIIISKAQLSFGLIIKLNPDKSIYVMGEPVILTLYIKNETSSTVFIYKAFDVSYGHIGIQVAYEDGIYRYYCGPQFGTKDVFLKTAPMEPDEEFSTSIKVLYNVISKSSNNLESIFAFSKPGKYRLRVELINIVPGEQLFSAPIEIEMLSPQGEDAKVWKLLQTKEAAHFLHFGRPLSKNKSIAKKFEKIIKKYPETIYAPYILASLKQFNSIDKGKQQGAFEIHEFNKQPIIIGSSNDSIDADKEANASKIIKLINDWTESYNSENVDQLVQYLSSKNITRQKWDQGPNDRDHKTILNRFKKIFATKGDVSIEIIELTIDNSNAKADILVNFELDTKENTSHSMKFILEDNNKWRILDVGF